MVIKNRISEFLAIKARAEGRKRYTQEEISNITGLTQQTVSTHIRNKVLRYDLRTIAIWCKFLGIKPEQFFTEVASNIEEDDIEPEMRTPLLATA
jgi:transcriptional regulator with XRE-family HTH domain